MWKLIIVLILLFFTMGTWGSVMTQWADEMLKKK